MSNTLYIYIYIYIVDPGISNRNSGFAGSQQGGFSMISMLWRASGGLSRGRRGPRET